MSKPFLGQQIVGLDGGFDVFLVHSDGHAHEQMLRPFRGLAVDLQQVGSLQGLETEEVVLEISIEDDGGVELVGVVLDDLMGLLVDQRRPQTRLGIRVIAQIVDDFGKDFLRLLVEIGNGDSGGECGVIGMLGGHGGRSLGGQVIQLDRGHAVVQTGDDLLSDLDRLDKIGIEPIAELGDARGDFVEVNLLLTPASLDDKHD